MDKTEEAPPPPPGRTKRPTGADKMNSEQNEYEHRVPQGEDPVERVLQHNSAFPKLIDELKKRRSTANIKMAGAKRRYDPKCRACRRLHAAMKLRQYDIRPRCSQEQVLPAPKKTAAARPAKRPAAAAVAAGGKTLGMSRAICQKCNKCKPRGVTKCRPRPVVIASDQDFRCMVLRGLQAEYARKHYSPICKMNRAKVMSMMSAREKEKDRKREKDRAPSNTSLRSERSQPDSDGRSSLHSFGSVNDEPMV